MKFEKLIKEKLKGHEYKYTPDKWQQMEGLLNSAKPVSGFLSGMGAATKTILIGISAASIIGVASWLSFGNNNDNNQSLISDQNQIEINEDYKIVNNKNLQLTDILSDCDEVYRRKIDNITDNKSNDNNYVAENNIKTEPNAKTDNSLEMSIAVKRNMNRIHINENLFMFMEPLKQEIVEEEVLPVIVVIPDDGSDYYFIPNPKHKIYDLPEPEKKIQRMKVEHKETKEKKPINKPSKRVFSRKKGLLERLGFKR